MGDSQRSVGRGKWQYPGDNVMQSVFVSKFTIVALQLLLLALGFAAKAQILAILSQ